MEFTFFGAAGEVTGSCTRVRSDGVAFLVDCGMFQGGREAGRRNLEALDFDLGEIDFVLLTHAHIDHSGLLPRLVALGYRGPIHATEATVRLLEVMLLDSAHIQEKEAERAARESHRKRHKHLRAAPMLYTVAQAQASLARLRPLRYDDELSPHPKVRCRFRDAGHILGSAILEIDVDSGGRTRRLVFSGDLGQPNRPVLRDPVAVRRADVLCVESTYGDRTHRALADTEAELVAVLHDTLERRGGNVIIPAFAVGRTQELIFFLAELVRAGRAPPLQVVVDSPMATAVTGLTMDFGSLWDAPTRELLAWMEAHRERFAVRFVADVEESIALNSQRAGLVIISASGMCDAGRIRHHLKYNLGRSACSIVICGFQAAGSLGRRLVDGVRQVTLFGERIAVRAQVHTIGGLSAHADRKALLAWLAGFEAPPRHAFVVRGEAGDSVALRDALRQQMGWAAIDIPRRGEPYRLD